MSFWKAIFTSNIFLVAFATVAGNVGLPHFKEIQAEGVGKYTLGFSFFITLIFCGLSVMSASKKTKILNKFSIFCLQGSIAMLLSAASGFIGWTIGCSINAIILKQWSSIWLGFVCLIIIFILTWNPYVLSESIKETSKNKINRLFDNHRNAKVMFTIGLLFFSFGLYGLKVFFEKI